MSEAEIWTCPQCQTAVDISEQGFMAEIMCPGCGMVNTVHTVLHNFRLERVLGVGGMSIVLQARDLVLNRTLAIKVLKDSYRNNPERVARFEKECALMAKVRHPNVVSVYSAGAANGQFYIAMELVEGTNLELMVSPLDPMPPLKALSIVRQVAKGLSAANKAGLLHRDIKPGNVLVTRGGRAKVLDFGLSLGKSDADTEETIWATPFYVPPETLLREQEDVRTDIYALGMTLRFLLSGYEAFADIPQNPQELLECKQSLPPIRSKDYGIDESYADLVNHMTAYDINARPTGYVDLLQELEEVQQAQTAYEVAHSPAGQKKERLKSVLHGLCVMALGLLVAWLSYLICIPAPEHEAIVFDAADAEFMHDETLLNEAEAALSQNLLANSAARFAILARDAKEPAMGAWGSLVALYLADLGVMPENRSKLADSFAKHMNHPAAQSSPSGSEAMEQFRRIRLAASDKDDTLASQHSLFNALFHASRMKFYAQENNKIELQIQQEKALQILESQRGPYANLAHPLKQWNDVVSLQKQLTSQTHGSAPDIQQEDDARSLHATSDVTSSDTHPASDASTPSSHHEISQVILARFEQRRRSILAEVNKVRDEIDAMLARKFSSSYRSSMSQEEKLELIRKMENPQLLAEVKTLYLIADGNLDAAEESNPHRNIPDSAEPFAVLSRRWMLGVAQRNDVPFPLKQVSFVSPKGISIATVQQNNRLAGGVEGVIVSYNNSGMTIQKHNASGSPQLVDYWRLNHDCYCELPSSETPGTWIEVADPAWRGPCYLSGDTLIHPRSQMKADEAKITQRDADSITIRWGNGGEPTHYKRSAKGVYLRQNDATHDLYSLISKQGKNIVLIVNKKDHSALIRESVYLTHQVETQDISTNQILLKNPDNNTIDEYARSDDGSYYYSLSN